MDSKELKRNFGKIAKAFGFEYQYNGWFKDSSESILVLNLQKSNFGDYFDLNIKIYIQGLFNKTYVRNKELVKDIGDIFRRQPTKYNSILNLEVVMDDMKRNEELKDLFNSFIIPFTVKALSKSGLLELEKKGCIFILPAVKIELLQ